MSRRARPLVAVALVLAVGCGPGDSDPAADSQIDPATVRPAAPSRPWAFGQGPGPDPDARCNALEDLTVAHHQPPARPPAAQLTPNCSLVDPAPFVAPHQPARHDGPV